MTRQLVLLEVPPAPFGSTPGGPTPRPPGGRPTQAEINRRGVAEARRRLRAASARAAAREADRRKIRNRELLDRLHTLGRASLASSADSSAA